MKMHQKVGRNAGNTPSGCGFDQGGPPINRDRTAPLDIAAAGGVVFGISANLPEFGSSAECFDQVMNSFHTQELRTTRRNVNANCVTQLAKHVDMREISDRLRWAREHRSGYSKPTEAAIAFGWTVSTYLGHENGDRKPSREKAMQYAKAYKIRWAWLLEGHGAPVAPNIVKVVGRVGASVGGIVDPDIEQLPAEGYLYEIEVPIEIPTDAVAFEVEGESMWPRYDQGDVIICWRQGTNPKEVLGWEAAVQTADGKRYLKRILEGSTPRTFDLESYNAPIMRSVKLEWVSRVNIVVRRGEWKRTSQSKALSRRIQRAT